MGRRKVPTTMQGRLIKNLRDFKCVRGKQKLHTHGCRELSVKWPRIIELGCAFVSDFDPALLEVPVRTYVLGFSAACLRLAGRGFGLLREELDGIFAWVSLGEIEQYELTLARLARRGQVTMPVDRVGSLGRAHLQLAHERLQLLHNAEVKLMGINFDTALLPYSDPTLAPFLLDWFEYKYARLAGERGLVASLPPVPPGYEESGRYASILRRAMRDRDPHGADARRNWWMVREVIFNIARWAPFRTNIAATLAEFEKTCPRPGQLSPRELSLGSYSFLAREWPLMTDDMFQDNWVEMVRTQPDFGGVGAREDRDAWELPRLEEVRKSPPHRA